MKTVTLADAQKMLSNRKINSILFDQGYTILMPKARGRKWLKALRSGEYIQADGTLHDPDIGGFCCLGVEQYCNNDGFVENSFRDEESDYGSWDSFPSVEYLRTAGMLYVNSGNSETSDPYIEEAEDDVSNLNDAVKNVTIKVNQHKTIRKMVPENDFAKMADYLDKAMLVY